MNEEMTAATPGQAASPWRVSDRYDPRAVALADRHYSRQKPGTPQFIPPGRYVALISADKTAVWVTSWAKYRMDAWRGAWVNTIFRKEGPGLASDMIRYAVAHTRAAWPQVPDLGMVTFIDPSKVKPKQHPGYCYLCAGFEYAGKTRKGLHVLRLAPIRCPQPEAVPGSQMSLEDVA
jgi:hypothetical protein